MNQSEQLVSNKNETGIFETDSTAELLRIKGMLYFGSDLSSGNYNSDVDLDFGYYE